MKAPLFVKGPHFSGIEYEADILLTDNGMYARVMREGSVGPTLVRLLDWRYSDKFSLQFGAPLAVSVFLKGRCNM